LWFGAKAPHHNNLEANSKTVADESDDDALQKKTMFGVNIVFD
jgi:hypothetical protein